MTALTATGQVLAGRYALTRWIAGGMMAEVWEATDQRMERTVAVKVLRPTYASDPIAIARFQNEARLAAKLDHPGIVKVHDIDVTDASGEPPWMVQEYVPGVPLSVLLDQTGALTPERAAHLISQAADAMSAAHQIGVVHRDLTPRNLLVTDNGTVKVTDLGIARTDQSPALTGTGQVVGSPAYLSPEQVRGRTAGPASDVYTLAVVLHECLAGERPFDGRTPVEAARAHLEQPPPGLPASVPRPLREVVLAALAKDPAARPSSAARFATALRASVGLPEPAVSKASRRKMSVPAPVPSPVTPSPRPPDRSGRARSEAFRIVGSAWARRPTSKAGLAGLAVLVIVAAAVIFTSGDAAGAAADRSLDADAGSVRFDAQPGKGEA